MDESNNVYIVVGGANTEEVVRLNRQLVQGEKHTASEVTSAVGGGGLNQAARLRAAGHDVRAILPLGEDATGEKWTHAIGGDCTLYAGYKTSHTIICLDERQERTILSIEGTAEDAFGKDVIRKVNGAIAGLRGNPYALLLGHVRRNSMVTTRAIIENAKSAAWRFLFPGRSQFNHCYHHWKDVWLQIDYLQLELSEARVFVQRSLLCDECRATLGLSEDSICEGLCLDSARATPTAPSILRFFQMTRMTAVVTLDQKGAVAVLREDKPGFVFLVFPYIVPGAKDPTGAGDAFGAGVARRAMGMLTQGGNPFSADRFPKVLETGTLWGALACLEFGGAANCLPANTIENFGSVWTPLKETLHIHIDEAGDWLRIFAG